MLKALLDPLKTRLPPNTGTRLGSTGAPKGRTLIKIISRNFKTLSCSSILQVAVNILRGAREKITQGDMHLNMYLINHEKYS